MLHIEHTMRKEHSDGTITARRVTHYEGVLGDSYALCGQDTVGDDDCMSESWDEAKQTNKRVNCPDCLAVRDHVLGRKRI